MDQGHMKGKSSGRKAVLVATLIIAALIGVIGFFMSRASVDVMSPIGSIGRAERSLIVLASLLSLIVVVPVFAMTFAIAWRYRATNTRATYKPDWDHSHIAETIWWAIPIALIGFLAVVTWHSTHALDPKRALANDQKPLTIQVVALEWRWLFLYPEQGVASLNYVELPAGRPIHFEITADAPMNSFWIPKLGGQIYAMSGMSTDLNLIADEQGAYRGSSANLSGSGFAGMTFQARAVSRAEFNQWTATAQHSKALDAQTYAEYARPSTDKHEQSFVLADPSLYTDIMEKYMHTSHPMHMDTTHAETAR